MKLSNYLNCHSKHLDSKFRVNNELFAKFAVPEDQFDGL